MGWPDRLAYRVNPSFEGEYSVIAEFHPATDSISLRTIPPGPVYGEGRGEQTEELAMGSQKYGVVQLVLNELNDLRLCPVPEGRIGLDGAQHNLEIVAGSHRVVYSWWLELPVQWAGLRAVVRGLEGLLDPR